MFLNENDYFKYLLKKQRYIFYLTKEKNELDKGNVNNIIHFTNIMKT